MAQPFASGDAVADHPGVCEERVVIRNERGEQLVGLLHRAESRKLVILCHGFRSTKGDPIMVTLASALVKHDISAFRFDFSGNGESEGDFQIANYRKETNDLHCVVSYFCKEKFDMIAIAGHSKGGSVVVLYASVYNDVPMVFNLSGRFDLRNGITKLFGEKLMDKIEADGLLDVKDKNGNVMYRVTKDSLMERLNTDIPAACLSISKECRVFSIHGSADEIIPVQDAYEFDKVELKIKSVVKMSNLKPAIRTVSHVILDLDGTLLNTDGVVNQVLKSFLIKHGKKWDNKNAHKLIGKTPFEAATIFVKDYELPYSCEEFNSMANSLFLDQWANIKPLPGADRLVRHLRSTSIPTALASNSPTANIKNKIACHDGWMESFSVIVGGDEVANGKPSPEIFIEAAKRMNVNPSNCLVIEDSLPGVMAGKAAGMQVIAVPSMPKQTEQFSSADEVINSLLDLQLEKWGLPPFEDWIDGTLPIDPWFIGGPVIKGFGRGSKVLGIPTANLPAENLSDALQEHTSGVYFGWAGLSTCGVYKMVMSIGWNPYFDNSEKTIEPWLLHDFGEDFYGKELRLVVVGYIRPEANFPSLESLIKRIHEDRRIAEKALDLPNYKAFMDSHYLTNPLQQSDSGKQIQN